MKYGILEAATAAAIIATSTFLLYTPPEPSWTTDTVANNTYGKFVEVDSYGENVGVAYVDSIDTGLRLAEKSYSTSITDFSTKINEKWSKQVIDNSSETGMYPSLESKNSQPSISYQDGDLGDEKLYYATRQSGEWNRTEVDNVVNGGVSVGMYSSLSFHQDKPVIFYHTPSQGLKLAEKNQGWNRQVLEDGQGWYTETSKCDNKIKVAYTGRNSDQLKIGEYNGEWRSENTSTQIKSDLDISTDQNCSEKLGYLDTETEQITYRDSTGSKQFKEAFFTRLGLTTEENITHMVYHDEGTGLKYARKEQGEWKNRTIMQRPEAGEYNDITVDHLGNVHAAYTNQEKVYHTVYNKGTTQKIQSKTSKTKIGLVVISTILLILTAIRQELLANIIQKMSELRN